MTTRYLITKTFTGGTLAGLTITERTTVRWTEGQEVKRPLGGSPYRIDKVEIAPTE